MDERKPLVAILTDDLGYQVAAIAAAELAGLPHVIIPRGSLVVGGAFDVMAAVGLIMESGASIALVHGFVGARYEGCEIAMRLAQAGLPAICIGSHNPGRLGRSRIPSVDGGDSQGMARKIRNYPTVNVEAIELPEPTLTLADGEYTCDSVTVYDYQTHCGVRDKTTKVVDAPKGVTMVVEQQRATLELGRHHRYQSFRLNTVDVVGWDKRSSGLHIYVGNHPEMPALTLHGVRPKAA